MELQSALMADWHITGPSWLPPMALLYVNWPTDDGQRVVSEAHLPYRSGI